MENGIALGDSMKSLKLDDEQLHRRLKSACAATGQTMLEAVHQMVSEWVEDVEKRIPALLRAEQTTAKRATRPKPGTPSRRQQLAANGQQEIPSDERQQEGSTTRELNDLARLAHRHRTA